MSKPGLCHCNKLLSYDIIEKEYELSIHMIYDLCFCGLSIPSYADWKKL